MESPMFDEARLREALQLQRKSYELLLWANRAVKEGRLKLTELHGNTSTLEAARSWIEVRTYGRIRSWRRKPGSLRP